MTGHMWLALTAIVAMGFDNGDPSRKEQARLAGVWSFALVEVDGKKQPEAPFATNKMILTKDGHYAIVQGPRVTRGTLKVDPSKDPKHYDPTIMTGRLKGLTFPGIYELDGDTLGLCFPLRGKERPAALASTPGSGLMHQVFKREKQEVKEALVGAGRLELAATWQAVSYSLDGKKAAAEELKNIKLAIDAEGKTAAMRDGQVFIASTTRIDPAARPWPSSTKRERGDSGRARIQSASGSGSDPAPASWTRPTPSKSSASSAM